MIWILDDDLMTAYNKGNKKVLQDVFDDIFIQSGQSAVDGQLSQSLQVVQGTPTLETYTEDQKINYWTSILSMSFF
ncbi:hypothetical protein SMH99_27020 [Spiroplasma poulsonii]|nr:hypothetical protein SMH99_27020 [Spiroplasma poulsonii]